MNIQKNISLRPYNTFGLEAKAAYFAEIRSLDDLRQCIGAGIKPVLILGGGSNMLLTQDQNALVIKNNLQGIRIIRTFKNRVWIEAGAGENWHQFVRWAVENGLGGVENLSLIPGTVGAAPIQNIGAYGVELKDVFVKLTAMSLQTGKRKQFARPSCSFGYRDSVFKREEKGKWCITSVVFSLTKNRHHLNISYGDIEKTLKSMSITEPSIAEISKAVIQIRSSKLPDPARIGNCGSFFKNPEISREELDRILQTHPDAPHYPLPNGRMKIPAGWLIEQCGWKGKRVGNTGCYEKQALVLVNYGGASGAEVKMLAQDIIHSVQQTFAIELEPEVNIL